jgi:nucleotide-binding universal stress UspA family protein
MNGILVAIDGSKHSEKVVGYAATLAKALSSKIVLLFVMEPVSIPNEYMEYTQAERIPPNYYDQVSQGIIDSMGALLKKEKVQYEGTYEIGNPTKRILDVAKSRKVSMIVVGVHGLHRLGTILALGSTARRVIENSDVPVVTVP